MSSQIRPYRFLPLLSIALATLAVSASCGADSAQAYVLGPASMPWSTSLSGTGAPSGDALITTISGSFSVPPTYRTPSGQVVNTGHLAIEYMQVYCPTGANSNPMFVIDSGPSLTTLNGAMIPTPVGSVVKVYFSAGDTFHMQWSGQGTCAFILFGELMPN
jgi:hypothetical protein